MKTVEELEERLSRPTARLVSDLKNIEGDFLVLGAGGKMGPSLCRLLKRALDEAGIEREIIAVSRFGSGTLREQLEKMGVKTMAGDLLDEDFLKALPEVTNVFFMAGTKFGTSDNQSYTWVMNAFLPGLAAKKFRNSRIIVFSTGNVYPFTNIDSGGATEEMPTEPVGEYGQSVQGRERMFEYFSGIYKTPVVVYRLNYAIDMRYGILLEVANAVWSGRPIDLSMGYVNVIWQGDANEYAIRLLNYCQSPPLIMNVTGTETISIKWLAGKFGERFGKQPLFENSPAPNALLSNATRMMGLLGAAEVTIDEMIDWTATWVENEGYQLGKSTHFQERKGRF
ncbi:MAG: NAD(P)-dependent oxidoreductase [Cyclobacteriaceae bacterium]|nr:NAD(P)-dependent oxidoreductase [Cyclobacteriaceae bacterium]